LPRQPESGTKHHGFHLRLQDVSDLDLLEAVNDQGGKGGWATSQTIGTAFGVPEQFAARVCAARFQWMKRWGWLDFKTEKGVGYYRVTKMGNSLIDGLVTEPLKRMLDSLSDGDRVRVTRMMGERAGRSRSGVQTMFRREFRRNAEPARK
jgi:hypothetical protein